MLQIATSGLFLMSSLYGQGTPQTAIHTASVADAIPKVAIHQNLDQKQVETYLRKEFKDTPILVEVARCESTFRQFDANGQVIRGIVNNADVGVMQINEKYHADTATRFGIDIYTMEGNVAFAKYLYKKYGTSPWVSSSPCWSNPGLAEK